MHVFHSPAPWLSFGPELVFSPDGKLVAAGIIMTPPPCEKAPTEPYPCIRVWDLQSGHELFSLSCQSSEWVWLTFDPSGRFLCICQWEAGLITILSVPKWELVETTPTAFPCALALYSPEGDLLLVNEGYVTLRVFDRKTKEELWRSSGDFRGPTAFNPEGDLVISGSSAGVITVWEAKEGKTMLSFHAHREGFLSLAFHPNGRYFATTGRNHMLKIWSVHDENLVHVLDFAQLLALENTAKPELAYFLSRVFAVSFIV